jgi:hypothetical protein
MAHASRSVASRPGRARFGEHALRVLLALALAWTGPGSYGVVWAQQDLGEDLLEAQVRLARAYEPLERLADGLDRRAFDVDALAFEVAFEEAEAIVAEVHRRVRFEPYHGVLRGAEGTLASGGGNAFDQALLSARLLGDAGYDVEIRRAYLDDALAEVVWRQVGVGGGAPDGAPVEAVADGWEAVPTAATQLDAEVERVAATLEAEVAEVDALLAAALPLRDGLDERLRAAARDYVWVAVRLGSDEPWSDLHPVFGGTASELAGLTPDTTYRDELPEDVQHRFRFQAVLERRVGDELRTAPVMAAWEVPTANLFGVPVTYTNVPDGLARVDEGSGVDAVVDATALFFPMLRGELPAGALAFDLTGATVPPDAAASPFAALFATVGRAVGDAVSSLGGLGGGEDTGDAVALTGFWLEFTTIAPDGSETVHRRSVVDRIGAEARSAGEVRIDPAVPEADVVAALMGSHTIMLDTGRYRDGYVLGRGVDHLLAVRPFLDDAVRTIVADEPLPDYPQDLLRLEEPIPPLLMLSTFAAPPLATEVVSYRPAPGLVVMTEWGALQRAEVDVVANPRWSFRPSASGPIADPAATRLAGAWETRTEGLLLARDDGEVVVPAMLAVSDATTLQVFGPGDEAALRALAQPLATREAMLEDVERGFLVLVPAEVGEGAPGWWRVDPITGATLGRGGDGRGNAFVEFLTSWQVSLAITAAFTGYGVGGCMSIRDGFRRGCCIVQNVAMGAVGFGLGYGLSAAVTGAAAKVVVFLKMDVQANLVGTLVPPICGS